MARLQVLVASLALVASVVLGVSAKQSQIPLASDDYVCQHPPYKVQLISKSPLVIYINDFITPEERKHLAEATYDQPRLAAGLAIPVSSV